MSDYSTLKIHYLYFNRTFLRNCQIFIDIERMFINNDVIYTIFTAIVWIEWIKTVNFSRNLYSSAR
jgi:hypothetical protein